jgi:phosphoglycerol transferase MdoB-like AlkP superfamily enzyme
MLLGLLATYLRLQASRGKKLTLLFTFLLPVLLFTVWMLHVRLAFHGASSKHALSIWNFVPVSLNDLSFPSIISVFHRFSLCSSEP